MSQSQRTPAISRPLGVDDDRPVPAPEVGGISHMWSMANTLARSISEHLQGLRDEYSKSTPADEDITTIMVEQLIDRFETDKKAVDHVRQVCWRAYHIIALKDLPPYYDTVLIVRTRLNFWLTAWNAYQQGRQADFGDKSTGNRRKKHLKEWLDEVDKLPNYPEEIPLYAGPNMLQILPDGCPLPETKPKPRKMRKEIPRDVQEEPLKGNATLSILTYRTPTRRVFDHRSRRKT